MLFNRQEAVTSLARTTRTDPNWLFSAALLFGVSSCALMANRVLGQQPTDKPSGAPQIAASSPDDDRKVVPKRLEDQVEELKKQTESLRARERDYRSQMREICGLSPENVMPVMLSLEKDRFALEIEVKLKSARKKDLADAIARETEGARQRGGADEISRHLEQIVEIRRRAVEVLEAARKINGAPESSVKSAQADLAEAEIRLALRKEELAKSRSEAAIEQLNRQLLDVSMEVAQDELRLALLQERLKSLAQAQGLLDDYKHLTGADLPRFLRLLDQAETRLAEMKTARAQ